MINKINDYLYYLDGTSNPLSAITYFIIGNKKILVIDPGTINRENEIKSFLSNYRNYEILAGATHFHPDHLKGIEEFDNIYLSKNTARYISKNSTIITNGYSFDLGNIYVEAYLIPSNHAKGSLVFYLKNSKSLIIGDLLVPKIINDEEVLDRSTTYEMIKSLDNIDYTNIYDGHNIDSNSKQIIEDYRNILKRK